MPKKQKHKSPYRKDKRPANKRFAILAVSSIILLAAAVLGFKYVNTLNERRAIQEYKSWSNQVLDKAIQDARHEYNIMPDGGCAVFVSWSDGKDRAQVRYGTGKDLKAAWQAADDALLSAVDPEKAVSNAEYIYAEQEDAI